VCVVSGRLPDDFDENAALDAFLECYYGGDPEHDVFLEEPNYNYFDGVETITIDSGYSYLPGQWFMEWISETYKVCIKCKAFSITDAELLDKYVVGVDYVDA
jgi:hypothetical protein